MYQDTVAGPKRGVSLYSYSGEFGFEKNLEDCFEDICDMGAHGIEILANTHIENYPYPTNEWVEKWFRLLDKYELVPVEYGHWVDSRVLQDRYLTTEEAVEFLERDLRLAHRLGFHGSAPVHRCHRGDFHDSSARKNLIYRAARAMGFPWRGFFTDDILHKMGHGKP